MIIQKINKSILDFSQSYEYNNNCKLSNYNSIDLSRGSQYRGVSRNGCRWQVLVMVNKKKKYFGSYSNEIEAARVYDKVALQNHSFKAKTNFEYTQKEIDSIIAEPPIALQYKKKYKKQKK